MGPKVYNEVETGNDKTLSIRIEQSFARMQSASDALNFGLSL